MVAVPIGAVLPGESPRLGGLDEEHVVRLSRVEQRLPPILVDRRSMRVIDGMHRLTAAMLRGDRTIDVEFFDGTAQQAFVRAVEANVKHGLLLTQADRCAAAERIMRQCPELSDRAIAQSTGLSPRTVTAIRGRSTAANQQSDSRLGLDGRVRPLDAAAGRLRVARIVAEFPQASVREAARRAGVSPSTASDVFKRLRRGESPVPEQRIQRPANGGAAARPEPVPASPEPADGAQDAVAPVLSGLMEKLLRDPALRHNEEGRRLLLLLRHNAFGAQEWSDLVGAVPSHCSTLVERIAQLYAQMWTCFAQELGERSRAVTATAG